MRIYRGGASPAPAVIYCHAGAFVLGNLDTDHLQCVEFARRGRCTVVSVDYRLAPEHPYPAALDDATTVLNWVATNAAALGVDTSRLAVAGSSAGAALAARLAQRAADGSVRPPGLPDAAPTGARRPPDAVEGRVPHDTGLRRACGRTDVASLSRRRTRPVDAAPGRITELSGVASALITCSELDPLRDEAVDYAQRLMGPVSPPNYMCFPAPATGSTRCFPIGKPVDGYSSYRERRCARALW